MHNTIEVDIKSKKYRQINYSDRVVIEYLLGQKASQSEIARQLNVNRSTISRELARNGSMVEVEIKTTKKHVPLTNLQLRYNHDVAHSQYLLKRMCCNTKYKLSSQQGYVKFIEDTILQNPKLHSPDVANALAKQAGYQCASTKTLYNWIDQGLLRVRNIDLLRKVGRRQRRTNTPKTQKRHYGTSIDQRPQVANDRQEFGHWEGDSIILAEHKGQILSLYERQQRIGLAFLFDDLRADNMVSVLEQLKSECSQDFSQLFKSITLDNGSEFAYFEKMNAICPIYYAHAYSSWERGGNENFNGIIRRFIPKGTSLDNIDKDKLHKLITDINNTPRKILNYQTPMQCFTQIINQKNSV
jgi:IS30 family transposase